MRWPLLLAALLVPTLAAAAEHSLRIVSGPDGKPIAVEALGLSKDQLATLAKRPGDDPDSFPLLSLYVLDARGSTQVPAMAGKYEVVGDALRFTPRFSLRPGL